eukprot:TRINITY_DN14142_c0_g1_i1.p1 TRINITY_DN14142_c0_g1~~TRINITY_DN14142_c0_g1_i1.p1  ORF type:complete len:669 (+),score=76.79 TRINITY_DN14142_c0_g1_i1:139-2145(+)
MALTDVPFDEATSSPRSQWYGCLGGCRAPRKFGIGIDGRSISKWFDYNVVPLGMFLHGLLVCLVTYQVLMFFHQWVTHTFVTSQHFSVLFMGVPTGTRTLLSPRQLQHAIEHTASGVFDVDRRTFNSVSYVVEGEMQADRLPVHVEYRNGTHHRFDLSRQAFLGGNGSAQGYLLTAMPFLYDRSVQTLRRIMVSFNLHEEMSGIPHPRYFIWKLQATYDGSHPGRFDGTLQYAVDWREEGSPSNRVVDLLVVVVATLSGFVVVAKVGRFAHFGIIERCHECVGSVDPLPLPLPKQVCRFYLWWGITLISNMVQIITSLVCMFCSPEVHALFSYFGWSAFFAWLCICQHFEFFPMHYVTIVTTCKGLLSVLQYMASIVPVFTAFMFLGICNFWKSRFFNGISASYATLFAVVNGDVVHDVIEAVEAVAGGWGTLYMYFYIILFIYVLLRVNFCIIEAAFFEVKHKSEQHDKHMQLPPEQWSVPEPRSSVSGYSCVHFNVGCSSNGGHIEIADSWEQLDERRKTTYAMASPVLTTDRTNKGDLRRHRRDVCVGRQHIRSGLSETLLEDSSLVQRSNLYSSLGRENRTTFPASAALVPTNVVATSMEGVPPTSLREALPTWSILIAQALPSLVASDAAIGTKERLLMEIVAAHSDVARAVVTPNQPSESKQ